MRPPWQRRGAVSVRLHLFGTPSAELRRALRPPWPRWMERLYGLEHLGDAAVNPERGETSVSAALSALANRLRHRLDLLAFVVSALLDAGWDVTLDGEDLVASKVALPAVARTELEDAGVYGPMCTVCDLDEHGEPRLLEAWQLR